MVRLSATTTTCGDDVVVAQGTIPAEAQGKREHPALASKSQPVHRAHGGSCNAGGNTRAALAASR
eukprot:CAMPEP_0179340512 /NCGR_PEP_ID=MMETSP0797-20121207/69325_1 /TAXON_ID=47934 /ORGANISM="Dinophysis acuminata, Strain DAEP01" /LENGTH=64 /DNA_ID=CAMNT_0021054489 /DNA_START=32 /DNA_END=224 /DNA_ORIENTATION=+